ncbi:DUF5304 domain-containing protein [Streptomyces sp. NPDC058953]|uniref:DUF5304 domain-containing protein n=1 Tax=unclassified Streptomyces TaxID=2593676 RepID=UPI0036A7DAE7
MSDATERPADADASADPWADACAEDLEAEKARRRAEYGTPPGSAGEELRKLFGAVADKVTEFQSSLPGMAAQNAVQQVVNQAKSAMEPVIDRNPQVFDHLAAAGGELLAAYRSAVQGQENRWTRQAETPESRAKAETPETPGTKPDDPRGDDPKGDGPAPGEQIDLD